MANAAEQNGVAQPYRSKDVGPPLSVRVGAAKKRPKPPMTTHRRKRALKHQFAPSKFQRSGGSRRSIDLAQRQTRDYREPFRWDIRPSFTAELEAELKAIRRVSPNITAESLAREYMQCRAFETLIKRGRVPAPVAGKIVFNCRPSASYNYQRKLQETGGSLAIFRDEAARLIDKGKIAPGRKTIICDFADWFFKELADGESGARLLYEKFGDTRHKTLGVECLRYGNNIDRFAMEWFHYRILGILYGADGRVQ
jgi:hypothetical protein